MILIGISGKKGVGKDLLASFLREKYGFVNLPFAQELKASVRRDFNLSLEDTDGVNKEKKTSFSQGILVSFDEDGNTINSTGYWTPREIMIQYGQFFRQFDKNYWIKKTFQKINLVKSEVKIAQWEDDLKFTISDVRFKNEADYIKEQGGYLVRLERKPELNIYKEQSTDLSEIDLDDYNKFDYILQKELNITPQDLKEAADDIMNQIKAKLK